MCNIYSTANPISYQPTSRSVRINGMVTSVRLENEFWDILFELARDEGVTTNKLLSLLYDEVYVLHGNISNFSSFVRVSCMRYIENRVAYERAAIIDRRLGARGEHPPS